MMRSTISLKKNVQLSSRLHSRFHETSTFKLHTIFVSLSTSEEVMANCIMNGMIILQRLLMSGTSLLKDLFNFATHWISEDTLEESVFGQTMHFEIMGGCFYAVWNFSKHINVPVGLNFFAAHHGFSLCDTHFGIELESKNFDETFATNLFKNPNISGKYLLNFAIQQLPFLIIFQIESFRRISSLSMKEASNLIQIFILYPTKQCFVEKTQTIKSGLK